MQALPISTWLTACERDWLRSDLIAGVTIWAIKGLDTLSQIADELSENGVDLRLANLHANAHDMLRRGGLATKIGELRIYWTLDGAVGGTRVEVMSTD
jgi:MFS superfamily sulfate permease-like transporter